MRSCLQVGQALELARMSNLILPGTPEFNLTLNTRPPNWKQIADQLSGEFAFVVRPEVGLWEPVGYGELDEYLYGGEYDNRLTEIEDVEETEESWEEWEIELSEIEDFQRQLAAALPRS